MVARKARKPKHQKSEYPTLPGQEINSIENYMPACRACNFYKSTMSVEKFRKQLETLPERLEKVFIYRLAEKYGIVKENCGKVKFYFENIKTGGENEANE